MTTKPESSASLPSAANDDRTLFPLADEESTRPLALLVCFAGLWLLSACVYVAVFSQVRHPYSVGIYQRMIKIKTNHWIESPSPRLMVLAGSNARVSHRAKILEQQLSIPVTNGGLSAATSAAFALGVFERHLQPGDVIYLPFEYESLVSEDRGNEKDYFYMIAYDREQLRALTPSERLRAWFSFDLTHLFSGPAEVAITRMLNASSTREEIDSWGDQIGNSENSGSRFTNYIKQLKTEPLPAAQEFNPDKPMIRHLVSFLKRCKQRNVLVIGGLPTMFDDIHLDPAVVENIADIYESNGQRFLVLPNRSQYPRACFYDSRYHLNEKMAEKHSIMLAEHLKPLIDN